MHTARLTLLATLLLAGAGPSQSDAAKAKAEAYRQRLAAAGFTVTGSGATTAKGELGKRAPKGIHVTVEFACHDSTPRAQLAFGADFPPYWTVQGKRDAATDQAKIYCRSDRAVHDDLTPNVEGAAIGNCVIGDVTLTILASHYGPGGDDSVDEAGREALVAGAVATVRTWMGKLGGPVPPEKPGAGPKVELVDANTAAFKAGEKPLDPTDEGPARRELRWIDQVLVVASQCDVLRRGAVADGASVLVVRACYPVRGRVTLTLAGDQTSGMLVPLGVDPWLHPGGNKLEVDTWANSMYPDKHWALALYVPPGAPGHHKGQREVRLSVEHRDEKGKVLLSEQPIVVVPPPIVLVHGTFDNPKACWDPPGDYEDQMRFRLELEGIAVFMVDWEQTNGHKDPSAFYVNRMTVWEKRGGIKQALQAMRDTGFAATQADLVCHSQGGVIARVYANGTVVDGPRPEDDDHFKDPRECARGGCHYHRQDNFARGDIHRLITISTTHMGSDICRLIRVLHDVKEASTDVCATLLLAGASTSGTESLAKVKELVRRLAQERMWTDGYRDQEPDSVALNQIGRTPVPAHAIACVASDADLETRDAEYRDRMLLTWQLMTRDALSKTFEAMGQKADAADLVRLRQEEELLSRDGTVAQVREHQVKAAYRLRMAVFGNQPNDCTVRVESSRGKLPKQYTTEISGVLHGYAPRYKSVQDRVLELLFDSGAAFCPTGFPAAGGKYAEK